MEEVWEISGGVVGRMFGEFWVDSITFSPLTYETNAIRSYVLGSGRGAPPAFDEPPTTSSTRSPLRALRGLLGREEGGGVAVVVNQGPHLHPRALDRRVVLEVLHLGPCPKDSDAKRKPAFNYSSAKATWDLL